MLRGDERAAIETDRQDLLRACEETRREREQLRKQILDQTEAAGPAGDFVSVLAEADMTKEERVALLRRAQEEDERGATQLRATAVTQRSTAQGSGHREDRLRDELAARAQSSNQFGVDELTVALVSKRLAVAPYASQTHHDDVSQTLDDEPDGPTL